MSTSCTLQVQVKSAHIESLTYKNREIDDGLRLAERIDLFTSIDDLSTTVCEGRATLGEVHFYRISKEFMAKEWRHTSGLLCSHKITWSEATFEENDEVCQETEV